MSFLLFMMLGCKTSYTASGFNYLSGTEQTISVRATGVGKNQEAAIINAEQKVFDVLLFRGFPESNQKIPMIGNDESAEKAKNNNYFDSFIVGKRYKSFIMSSVLSSELKNVKNGKSVTVDLKINLSALRNDLETFGVIRKFGL